MPELVDFFVAKHSMAMGKRVTGATSETMRLLMAAQWKGNVRQLDNAIERAVMMCDDTRIEPKDLPPDLLGIGQPLPDTDDLRTALSALRAAAHFASVAAVARQTGSRQAPQAGAVEPLPQD